MLDLPPIPLSHGEHARPEQGICLMEAAAYLAGREHTDHPPCTCPVFGAYGRAINDWLPDKLRQRLRPLLPRLIGSASPEHEQRRVHLLADAAVRIFAPLALDAAGLHDEAKKLRELPELSDQNTAGATARAADAAGAAEDQAIAAFERAIDADPHGYLTPAIVERAAKLARLLKAA